VQVKHPKFEGVSTRSVGVDRDGRRYVVNHGLFIKPEHTGGGLGADIFSAQVEAASREGFDYIVTHAAKGPSLNGYATWPKFGYDLPLDDLRGPTRDAVKAAFPEANTVLDVLSTKEGEEWWCGKKNPDGTRTAGNGTDMHEARFDLDPGSRSMAVLGAYLRKKAGTTST